MPHIQDLRQDHLATEMGMALMHLSIKKISIKSVMHACWIYS